MTAVALALAAAIAVLAVAFVGALDRQRRAHTRQLDVLVNQLLHAAGRTWTPPPAAEKPEPAERPVFVASPEQQPLD